MDIFGILTMIGGLALFLYGMDIMGEGLSKASGGKLERILELSLFISAFYFTFTSITFKLYFLVQELQQLYSHHRQQQ